LNDGGSEHTAVCEAESVPSLKFSGGKILRRRKVLIGAFVRTWKPERDGARRGRANFQQKIMRDQVLSRDNFLTRKF